MLVKGDISFIEVLRSRKDISYAFFFAVSYMYIAVVGSFLFKLALASALSCFFLIVFGVVFIVDSHNFDTKMELLLTIAVLS